MNNPDEVPRREVEITPEMIAAGASELVSFDRDFESHEDGAIAIYRAMEAVRPRRPGDWDHPVQIESRRQCLESYNRCKGQYKVWWTTAEEMLAASGHSAAGAPAPLSQEEFFEKLQLLRSPEFADPIDPERLREAYLEIARAQGSVGRSSEEFRRRSQAATDDPLGDGR